MELVDARPEVFGISSEGDFQQCQETVHPCQQALRPVETERCVNRHGDSNQIMSRCGFLRVGQGVFGRDAIKDNDSVGQVGCHDEVVFYHKRRLLGVEDVPADTKWWLEEWRGDRMATDV